MVKKIKISYRFLSRKFLDQKRIKKIVGINLVAIGLLFGILPSGVEAFYNRQIISDLSTIQFTVQELTTLKASQFPLKTYDYISQYFSYYHPGIDLSAPFKTPIYPIEKGEVKAIYSLFYDYGRYIVIDHGDGLESLYAHLSSFNVNVGDKVTKESVIGFVGATGRATGSHLHLEIWINGKALNPLEVLGEK
ncbi:M23 family metallopeptidase [Candidatus Microgenomates bacterium]|nr:M23 family metallopeptidase [Candidatus Microgenomates bacterium]